jgi:hypothetical protein
LWKNCRSGAKLSAAQPEMLSTKTINYVQVGGPDHEKAPDRSSGAMLVKKRLGELTSLISSPAHLNRSEQRWTAPAP